MKNRIVFNALSINTMAKIMKVFSAGGGQEGKNKQTNHRNRLIHGAEGPGLVLRPLAALSDTESLEQEPDSPVAASLPDKCRESGRLGKNKSD